jgi:four helix bundle protein
MDLVVEIYRVTKLFPRDEWFGLTQQLRRAAVSVPSNIAEGTERDTAVERRRYLTIARSSVAEIDTQLEAACRLEYISRDALHVLLTRVDRVAGMLTRLKHRIKDRPAAMVSRPSPNAHPPTR